MTVVSAAALGIVAVLLAVQFKAKESEYGIYLVMAAGMVLFFFATGKMRTIIETAKQIQSYIDIDHIYITTLLKMVGITYIAEFASGICKDAGYGSLGTQIEIFGKLSILAVSMPILLALLETLRGFLT
ncbi:MAG: stage III sporulation protein AD [Clostridium sp.]